MSRITKAPLPANALLMRYHDAGCYTDCFSTKVNYNLQSAEFIEAFYTTWLFKLERAILKWLVRKPSTDEDARLVGLGRRDSFAAWEVEDRADNQLLLRDYRGKTCSWLMTEPLDEGAGTRLYFGSAVVLLRPDGSRKDANGRAFKLLLGFHKLYSRALLRCAASRITRLRQ